MVCRQVIHVIGTGPVLGALLAMVYKPLPLAPAAGLAGATPTQVGLLLPGHPAAGAQGLLAQLRQERAAGQGAGPAGGSHGL